MTFWIWLTVLLVVTTGVVEILLITGVDQRLRNVYPPLVTTGVPNTGFPSEALEVVVVKESEFVDGGVELLVETVGTV